jgi:hypothetical protein
MIEISNKWKRGEKNGRKVIKIKELFHCSQAGGERERNSQIQLEL